MANRPVCPAATDLLRIRRQLRNGQQRQEADHKADAEENGKTWSRSTAPHRTEEMHFCETRSSTLMNPHDSFTPKKDVTRQARLVRKFAAIFHRRVIAVAAAASKQPSALV